MHTAVLWFVFCLTLPRLHALNIPHYDLEMSPEEYRVQLNQSILRKSVQSDLQVILDTGKRLLDWLAFINQKRTPAAGTLAISSAATQNGPPIDRPLFYSATSIKDDFAKLKIQLPARMADVLFASMPFTENAPIPEADFSKYARALLAYYSLAARYLLLEPYLPYFRMIARDDIRGFYFLSKEANLADTLKKWWQLSVARQSELRNWLIGLCANSYNLNSTCQNEFDAALNRQDLFSFYQIYLPSGQTIWAKFFGVVKPRSDVTWSALQPLKMSLPFVEPARTDIKQFLVDNIEDEWRWDLWQLKLNFSADAPGVPHLTFSPGVTAHVDSVGGNRITMDSNRPLNDYDTRWTIRHEFGHVLGFNDCYFEFYDDNLQAFVNYQIDQSDLMCSRMGKFKERHLLALKQAYFRP